MKIIYEDRDLLVCYKQAGLPVQSRRMDQMDLESLLKNHLAVQNPGKMPYLAMIHRLDQPVEGLLVFGKNKKAAGILSKSLQTGDLKKGYLAVVHFRGDSMEGRLEDWLKKDGKNNSSQVVSPKTPGSKQAVLNYKILKESEEKALAEISLETGRHHQIRVQMSHRGMPLLGDRKYGNQDGVEFVALCAHKLEFKHPTTGKKLTFKVKPQGKVFQPFLDS